MFPADLARCHQRDVAGVVTLSEVVPHLVSGQGLDALTSPKDRLTERMAGEVGLSKCLHLWPDPDLGKAKVVKVQPDPVAFAAWLQKWWDRISEWPGVTRTTAPAAVRPSVPVVVPAKVAETATAAAPSKALRRTLTVRTPNEILGMEFDPDDQFIENGVFARGQSLSLLGPGGLGKSRLLLQLAVCTIVRKAFVGMAVRAEKLKWLIVQAENSNRRLKADLEGLKAWVGEKAWEDVETNLIIHTLEEPEDSHISLGDDKVVEDLTKKIAKEQPDVIAFDPLAAIAVGSLNNDAGMTATCQAIAKLSRAGGKLPSVVVLHHTLTGKAGASKASGYDRASYGRGSKALNFWTRGQINIAAANEDDSARLIVTCGKNSNGKDFASFGIRLNAETLIYAVDTGFDHTAWVQEFGATTKAKLNEKLTPEAVAGFVHDVGLKKKDLVRALMDETGCEKSTAYTAIAAAEGKTIKRDAEKKFQPI